MYRCTTGASTDEAEENSAAMAADTIMNFLKLVPLKIVLIFQLLY